MFENQTYYHEIKQFMSGTKRRELQDIDRDIASYKGHINNTEGRIISNLTKYSTPNKQPTHNNQMTSTASKEPTDEQEVVSYIKNINQLRDTLEEKTYLIEIERQKERLNMQNEINRYKNLSIEMEKTIKKNNQQINAIKNQIAQLQQALKDKQSALAITSQQLSVSRRQQTELKLQNKNLKADNKVIMTHIDRLTKEKKLQQRKDSLAERELRVMKSLYMQKVPGLDYQEAVRRQEVTSTIKNKMMVEQSVELNAELKTLIRRLNEQIELLKREKQALALENKHKVLNLQSQKDVVRLAEEEKQVLNGVIHKMGEKIMNLELINQTLKETIDQLKGESGESDENYYRQTKAKAGQFYYRK